MPLERLFFDLFDNQKIYLFLEKIWINNFSQNGFEHLARQLFIELKGVNSVESIREIMNKVLSENEFKRYNRKIRESGNLNEFTYKLLEESLAKANNYLDFGCGRMALIRRICKENNLNIKAIYGFEPKAQIDYLNFDPRVKLIRNLNEVEKLENIDLITINFVLHHLTKEEIIESLRICKKILAPNGRIVVLEESYLQNQTDNSHSDSPEGVTESANSSPLTDGNAFLERIGYSMNTELTKEFESLPVETKKQIIFANDYLMNYNNLEYMPWTMEYHSIEEWRRIFEANGLTIKNEHHLGFAKGAKMKGGTVSAIKLDCSGL